MAEGTAVAGLGKCIAKGEGVLETLIGSLVTNAVNVLRNHCS